LSFRIPGIKFVEGESSHLPFKDDSFDISISWHAIYYVGLGIQDVVKNFQEIYRVTKKDSNSRFIVSIPMPSSFIYSQSELVEEKDGIEYREIKRDPFNVRNGEILGCFPSLKVLRDTMLQVGFTNLQIGEEKGVWFGHQYDWWVIVANLK
jgi:ubiquinone/menaquinone biosynthesis C-methylase UbiE